MNSTTKEILRITFGLTFTCLFAAFVMGAVFVITAKAKKYNEYLNFQEKIFDILGYSETNPPPDGLQLNQIYRYIIEKDQAKYLGYIIPIDSQESKQDAFELVVIDLKGQLNTRKQITLSTENSREDRERKIAIQAVLPEATAVIYADTFLSANLNSKRLAYLLPGKTPGFKTAIQFMLALDSSYTIKGLEILEHQEDPGLGAEIERNYFKKQFVGKTLKRVKTIDVVKKPLPEDYRNYLEPDPWKENSLSESKLQEIHDTYKNNDIYAITGATISSAAVTNGVKNALKKFTYRVQVLDQIISENKIPAAF